MIRRLLFLALWATVSFAQQKVQNVPVSYTTFTEYNAGGNPLYICRASVTQATSSFSVALSSLTNIVVSGTSATVTFPGAHGFLPGYKLIISGANYTPLNGTYRVVAADPAATVLTINVATGLSPGTYTDMTVSTDTALLIKPVWAIEYFYWVVDENRFRGWTNGNQQSFNQICANRAVVYGAGVVVFK